MIQPPLDARLLEAVVRSLARPGDAPAVDSSAVSATRMGAADTWLLRVSGRALILKRYRRGQDETDVRWEHDLLEHVAATGFPASRPVQALDGRSWRRLDDRVWGALTYLPGGSFGWTPQPGLDMAGMFLAAYHHAARSVQMERQRPSGTPLLELAALAPWDRLAVALEDAGRLRQFAQLLDELGQELQAINFGALDQIAIHGDPTADNMLINGTPPQLVGLIDFGNAAVDGWLADLGAGLWRSGRTAPDGIGLDTERVATFVAGYHRRSALDLTLARAVPLLIKARGLQLIVRWTRRAAPEALPSLAPLLALTLDRAVWISERQPELADAVERAVSVGRNRLAWPQ